MTDVVITAAKRTAVGSFLGAFAKAAIRNATQLRLPSDNAAANTAAPSNTSPLRLTDENRRVRLGAVENDSIDMTEGN